MDFTPITTQEQLNEIIGERLKRDRDATAKKYEGWMSPDDVNNLKAGYDKQLADAATAADSAAKKYADYDKQLADRDTKIKNYETASVKARIAHETGLSYDAIKFLQGDDEESIKASADSLKTLMGSVKTPPAPLANPDPGDGNGTDYKNLLHSLRGE